MNDDVKYSTTRIADLNAEDKPREKAMNEGVRSLTSSELIAIVLGSGLPGKSVIELSREILKSCDDSLDRLSRMTIKEMTRKFKGVGPAKAVSLAAALELGRRSSTTFTERPQITSSQVAFELLRPSMADLDHEEFRMLILNRANRVVAQELISSGGTAGTVVDVKMVLKRAIDSLAEGIIVAHNHPSGNVMPSVQDDNLTKKIAEGCKAVDIHLLDHIIITPQRYYSYADMGKL